MTRKMTRKCKNVICASNKMTRKNLHVILRVKVTRFDAQMRWGKQSDYKLDQAGVVLRLVENVSDVDRFALKLVKTHVVVDGKRSVIARRQLTYV